MLCETARQQIPLREQVSYVHLLPSRFTFWLHSITYLHSLMSRLAVGALWQEFRRDRAIMLAEGLAGARHIGR
jgi:hypothetical protein